jgi:hypothetical protein
MRLVQPIITGLLASTLLAAPLYSALAGDPPPPKNTQALTKLSVLLLHATNDGTGIDPALGKMPELRRPPFSSYNSYKLLERAEFPLAKGASRTTNLPTGRQLKISLKNIIEPLKKGDPKRYVVTASIQKPDGDTFLPLLEVNAKAGENFFVAGQNYKGGSLVIGIKVLP